MTAVVAVVSQKGGVGKSTLVRALSQQAAKSSLSVKIADLDTQQGTASNWHRNRLNRGRSPVGSVEVFRTAKEAMTHADHYDLLILDGAPRASTATLEIAREADLVIQPTGASLDDLEPAILLFHELTKAGISKSGLAFALTRIGTETESKEAVDYIQEAGYSVLDGVVYEKPAYRQAQNDGLAITETRYKSLNARAEKLIESITNRLLNS
jgi:chromosome partitioning protein